MAHIPGKQNVLADALSRLSVLAITRSAERKQHDDDTVKKNDNRKRKRSAEAQSNPQTEMDELKGNNFNNVQSTHNLSIGNNENEKANQLTSLDKLKLIRQYHSFGHFGREATVSRLRIVRVDIALSCQRNTLSTETCGPGA